MADVEASKAFTTNGADFIFIAGINFSMFGFVSQDKFFTLINNLR